MVLPDVNVLINAFRPDAVQHALCKAWLENVLDGETRFGVSPLSLTAVVRIVTNPRTYKSPSPLAEVFAFCDDLLAHPFCEAVEPRERHWAILKRLCVESGAMGPFVSDVWYAALAMERGCRFITLDRDFARFPGLDWRAPDAR